MIRGMVPFKEACDLQVYFVQSANRLEKAAKKALRCGQSCSGTGHALEAEYAGLDLSCRNDSVLPGQSRLRRRMPTPMSTWELILGSAGAVLLTAYLVYALLRPERF